MQNLYTNSVYKKVRNLYTKTLVYKKVAISVYGNVLVACSASKTVFFFKKRVRFPFCLLVRVLEAIVGILKNSYITYQFNLQTINRSITKKQIQKSRYKKVRQFVYKIISSKSVYKIISSKFVYKQCIQKSKKSVYKNTRLQKSKKSVYFFSWTFLPSKICQHILILFCIQSF